MQHVIVKLSEGRSEHQKQDLADRITETLQAVLGVEANAISIAVQDVSPMLWYDAVYRPEIEEKKGYLYKKPGYCPR
ncbi:4-oxalocrotonate tautomerase [Pandoraea captiosa]|uniref:4-oxalocrotonate tautomerase n=1 Tax=Pandoraea captiosa TaxID=2508302 RepID=A0A5E5A546_9BURK|nr:tautomerase family protein [Pandoraea captiosa]VVE68749.1 4-oxalocrotonate tautomerase [Pandoraea captiosa]